MLNLNKRILIFLFILLQMLLAIAGGLIAAYTSEKGKIPSGTFIGSTGIGGMDKRNAVLKLEESYDTLLKNSSLVINLDTGDEVKEFPISYDSIDAIIDYNETVNQVYRPGNGGMLLNLIQKWVLGRSKSGYYPVIKLDDEKVNGEISKIAGLVNKEVSDASVYINNGSVIKTPEVYGFRLNVENTVSKVKNQIGRCFSENVPLSLNASGKYEAEVVYPKALLKDLEGADEIISAYSTDIKSLQLKESMKIAAAAANRVLVFSAVGQGNSSGGEFSFNKYLSELDTVKGREDEGYNQVVSTLHAAVLQAGIDPAAITRTRHDSITDYISPGLDVTFIQGQTDYKFKNTLGFPIVIFAEVKDNRVVVTIVGKKQDSALKNSLAIDIGQHYLPAFSNIENKSLQPGENKLASPGKEGVDVNVSLVTARNGTELERKLLYTEKYAPVDSVMAAGSDVKADNKSLK